jgi:hypothetical protein
MIRDGLLRAWCIDLKGGTETERGQALFHRWATRFDDALDPACGLPRLHADAPAGDARSPGAALRDHRADAL